MDWVYEEELDVRSNYFWSPDSKHLAYLQTDESSVPQYPIVDWIPTHATIDVQRYPQPGDPNPYVRVGVVSVNGGKTKWINVPFDNGNDYIPRFGWVNDTTVWIETLTRDQKELSLYFADTANENVQLMLTKSDDKFLDEAYDRARPGFEHPDHRLAGRAYPHLLATASTRRTPWQRRPRWSSS